MYKPLGGIHVGGHAPVQREQAVNCEHGGLNCKCIHKLQEKCRIIQPI